MERRILVLVSALALQASAQVDNHDPRVPRPSATFPSPVGDYYGVSRPAIEPSAVSYRPSGAGPVLVEPAGTGRPTGLPLAYDSVGYANGYPGIYGGGYDLFLTRPPVYVSNVGGSHVFPETNTLFARVPMTPIQGSGVVMPFMPLSTVSVGPAAYPAAPVNYPVGSYPVPFNPVIPSSIPSANPAPVFPGVASNFPMGGFPSASHSYGNGGLSNTPVSNLPNLPNLQNLPVGSGNLQLGSGAHPLNSFGGSSSSVIPNGNFIPQV